MAVDLQALGSKVRRCREQLQLTPEEVSGATGIEVQRLLRIEAGGAEPTGDEVLILADHFKIDYKFFVSAERLAPLEQTETLYRKHPGDLQKSDRRAVQDFLYLCETEEFLMRELNRASRPFAFRTVGTFYKRHGADAAAALRAHLGYSDRELPRDIYADFRLVGVHVFRRKLGNSDISGLFIQHPTAGSCALVNASEDVYRQRFSAAHEMAHAIFDSEAQASISFVHPQRKDLTETRANRFASHYLMPPAFLRKLPNPQKWTDGEIKRHANEMRVSCEALSYALLDAELVTQPKAEEIRRTRVPREAKVDPELPASLTESQRARKSALLELGLSSDYVALCFEAEYRGIITLGRLAEALLCHPIEVPEIAQLYRGAAREL